MGRGTEGTREEGSKRANDGREGRGTEKGREGVR